ncbi:RraA family protein [Mesorhizobium sp. 1B3]|uniref:RraA family protein n=1 Tax=Mesorhizobium sp. 1B3 TaxID=3243599 RepID=UPI003D9841BD
MAHVNSTGRGGCALGLRIYERIHRASQAELAALSNASSCDISDVARGRGVVEGGIRGLYSPMGRIFGSAITVDLTPGDGLLLRAAISVAKPGDVIVANAHGETSRAVLGGVIAMHMVKRGVAGLVVDGVVRDVGEFRQLGLPVMARGFTPRSGSTTSGFGEVNVPVACGGAVVCPGDIVIGDAEGLVVVPRLWAGEVARAIGAAGHPEFAPETITRRLKELAPDTPVLGMDSVYKAVAERNGVIIDGAFDDVPGPSADRSDHR